MHLEPVTIQMLMMPDEMRYNYDNFNIIGKLNLMIILKVSKREYGGAGVNFDQTRIELEIGPDGIATTFTVNVNRARSQAKGEDDDVMDENTKNNGLQLDIYELKLVKENDATENSSDSIDKKYMLETFINDYET